MVSPSGQPSLVLEHPLNKNSQLCAVVKSQKLAVAYYLLPARLTKIREVKEQECTGAKENFYQRSTHHLIVPTLQTIPPYSNARGVRLLIAHCQHQADRG